MIRKATFSDLAAITAIYEAVHSQEEAGLLCTGWQRGVYPTEATVLEGLNRDDYFVEEVAGDILAAAVINQIQVPVYAQAPWQHPAPDAQVMVLHTLAVAPQHSGRGYAKAMLHFYERYARAKGCPYLRLDTQKKNTAARSLYRAQGYTEIAILPCPFNGIGDVELVLLEKKL